MDDSHDTIMQLAPGTRLGEVEIVRQLSNGGQAQIYLARTVQPNQLALPALQRRLAWLGITRKLVQSQQLYVVKLAIPAWKQGLLDEFNYLRDSQVAHPQIGTLAARTLGWTTATTSRGQPITLPYLRLTYLFGGSLKNLLQRRKRRPLPPPVAVAIALQVAVALRHLHTQAGIVHHDISPSNIMLSDTLSLIWPQQPRIVLIDLATADMPARPQTRQIYGKRAYLPPERLTIPPQPIAWSIDVYGLGVVLYEMLVGRLPRQRTDTMSGPLGPLPPIREHAPALSDALAGLVMAMVDHHAERRPSIGAVIEELRTTPEARQPAGVCASWTPRLGRQIIAALAILSILIIVLLKLALGSTPAQVSAESLATVTPIMRIAATPEATPRE